MYFPLRVVGNSIVGVILSLGDDARLAFSRFGRGIFGRGGAYCDAQKADSKDDF